MEVLRLYRTLGGIVNKGYKFNRGRVNCTYIVWKESLKTAYT